MTKERETVYIDMDDTQCDFMKAYSKAIEEVPGIQYPQSQYKFFERLEPIEGSVEAYHTLCERYDVWMLTRPSVDNPLCYTEKRVWVEEHLGKEACDKLILCCDKTRLIGDFLIDDTHQSGKYVPTWTQIMFGNKVNPDWKSVVDYLMNRPEPEW